MKEHKEVQSRFVNACKEGDHEKAILCLTDSRLPPEHRARIEEDRSLGLIKAAMNGHINVVQCLLNIPELTPGIPQEDINHALVWACQMGHLDVVDILVRGNDLSKKADPYSPNNHHRPLSVAIMNQNFEVVSFLLKEFYMDNENEMRKVVAFSPSTKKAKDDVLDIFDSLKSKKMLEGILDEEQKNILTKNKTKKTI